MRGVQKTQNLYGGPTSGRSGPVLDFGANRSLSAPGEGEDRKTMEEARSARCPKEQIQRGHADVAERRTG